MREREEVFQVVDGQTKVTVHRTVYSKTVGGMLDNPELRHQLEQLGDSNGAEVGPIMQALQSMMDNAGLGHRVTERAAYEITIEVSDNKQTLILDEGPLALLLSVLMSVKNRWVNNGQLGVAYPP